jgi:6-phosphogluconate dehydrogenase (decarboxylating)
MELALIGLGRMEMNMAARLLQNNHRIVAYDLKESAVKAVEKTGGRDRWLTYSASFSLWH